MRDTRLEDLIVTFRTSQDTVDEGSVVNGTPLKIPPPGRVAPFEIVDRADVPTERPSEFEAPLERIDSGVAPVGTPKFGEHEAQRRRRRRIVSLVVGLAALTSFCVARTDHSVRGHGKIAAKKWAPITTEAAGIVRTQIKREGEFVHAGESIAALDTSLESDAVSIAELDVAQATRGMEVDDLQLARNAIDLEQAAQVPADGRHEEGYFDLQHQYRTAMLELTRSGKEATTLAQLRNEFPSIAGQRNGELEALRRALTAFLASGRAPVGTRKQDDKAGWDGDAARAEVARLADLYLTGVSASANRIEELNSPGLATFKKNALQLRSGFSNTDRTLRKVLEVRGLLKGGFVAARELDDQVALAERESSAFLDSINAVRLSARELIERRRDDVELEKARARDSLEITRERLHDAMTVSKAGKARNAVAPARLKLLENERLQLQAAHSEHESALAKAKIALKVARRAVEARHLKAPMDGVIISLTAHERSVLARDESVGVVQALDSLVFKATVSDDELGSIKVGQPARVHLDEGKTGPLEGRVVWKASRVGEVVEKDYWNVLVAVDGGEPSLLPTPNGRVDILVERPRGVERLRSVFHPPPPVHRPYPSPQVVDPTLLAPEPSDGRGS